MTTDVTTEHRGIFLAIDNDDAIERKLIDNPGTEYAQWRAELATGGDRAGKTEVARNMRTLMGGFYAFRGSEAEQRAATVLRNTWERAIVGGSRAVDPSVEPVDGGYRNPEAVFEQGVDARALKLRIEAHLGHSDTSRLSYVVMGDHGPTAYAKWRYGVMNRPDGRTVSAGAKEIIAIAARLAVFLDLTTAGASRGTRVQGDRPSTFTGEISTRKVA